MRKRAIVLAACGALVLTAACEALVGIEDRSVGAADSGVDATIDAAADVGADTGPTCAHATVPPKPATDDGTADLELYLAMRTIDLGVRYPPDGSVRPIIGFDLDGLCTCPDPKPCTPLKGTDKQCDDDAGRDDALGNILQLFAAGSSGVFNQQTYNDAIDQGLYTVIVRVSSYNGGANDTAVDVAVFISNGTAPSGGDAGPPPAWNGNDVFTLDQGSVIGPVDGPKATPAYIDGMTAYVADHVLVAHVDFPMRVVGTGSFGALTVSITSGVLSGRLVPESGAFRLDDGMIAGRWAVKNMPEALAELPDFDGGFSCPGTPTYIGVKPQLCRAADLFVDPLLTDPVKTCDALSVAFGITAFPAKMGPKSARPTSPSPCIGHGPDTCQ